MWHKSACHRRASGKIFPHWPCHQQGHKRGWPSQPAKSLKTFFKRGLSLRWSMAACFGELELSFLWTWPSSLRVASRAPWSLSKEEPGQKLLLVARSTKSLKSLLDLASLAKSVNTYQQRLHHTPGSGPRSHGNKYTCTLQDHFWISISL